MLTKPNRQNTRVNSSFSHLVRNTVPCPSSWIAAPLKKEPTTPCAISASANSGHSSAANSSHTSAPVAAHSSRWPTLCKPPRQSLRRINSRSSAGSTGDRYHLTRKSRRTSASGRKSPAVEPAAPLPVSVAIVRSVY